MKLKSILMLSMVAILAMVGGAMAATTTTTTTSLDLDGALFGRTPDLGPNAVCAGAAVDAINSCTITAGALAADWGGGSGTGFGPGSVPAQVEYGVTPNDYTLGTADSLSGYNLNQSLFGMCGDSGCSVWVPTPGVATLAQSQGSDSIPANTDNFNQASFTSALVSGFEEGPTDFGNRLSQQMNHNGVVTDADFIDQRLAMFEYADNTDPTQGFQVMNQSVQAGGGLSTIVDLGVAEDPLYVGFGTNSGAIKQAVGDNQGGQQSVGLDIGSYGQLFNNGITVTDGTTPPTAPDAPASTYDPATQTLVP